MAENMIAEELEMMLHVAFVEARLAKHATITVEHILDGLAASAELVPAWAALKVDAKSIRREIAEYINRTVPRLEESTNADTSPTQGFQRVIQRAIIHAQSSEKKTVGLLGTLVALFGERDSFAVELLNRLGVSRLDVVNFWLHGIVRHQVNAEEELRRELLTLRSFTKKSQQQVKSAPKVFISYSHEDRGAVDRLLVHLRPLHRANRIDCWSDARIRTGDKWRAEIQKNLEESSLAILLVSADFLASDFIVNNELPPLLARADAKGIRILPVILKPCGFVRDVVLSNFQAINDPSSPLLGLEHIGQEALYNKIADEVAAEIQARNTRKL